MSSRSIQRSAFFALLLLLLTGTVQPLVAQRANVDEFGNPLSLPTFDVRTTGLRSGLEQVGRDPAATAARAAAIERLAASVSGLRVHDDPRFGTPHFVGSTTRMLTDPAATPWMPRDIVRDFVAAWPDLFEIPAAELDAALVTREFVTKHNGVTHFTWQQLAGGLRILGAEMRANVTATGELINISSTLLPRPAADFDVAAPGLDAAEAMQFAARNIGIATPPEPITGELIAFPLARNVIRPAWRVQVAEPATPNNYEVVVDAVDGSVLFRRNRTLFFAEPVTFRVYTSDSPAPGSPGDSFPAGFQFPVVPRQVVFVPPAEVTPYSPNTWIDDGVNETIGNNVDAHSDLDFNDLPDLPRPHGSPYKVFDFPLDLAQAPGTYVNAAVTQLFYTCNRYHDRLYALGFDEAAGNFQQNNFGLGGLGGDRLIAQAQDGPDFNNAWFISNPDGQVCRIEMFLWDAPTPDRDSDLDTEIVYHEYTHGVSTRLSGDTLLNDQSAGMGEGWSDFVALTLLAEPGDDDHAVYAIAAYTTFKLSGLGFTNYYFGIRRFPYSTDMTKSPLTYADIDGAQFGYPPSVPYSPLTWFQGSLPEDTHNVGEIWCQALLECRANLSGPLGFAVNQTMLQLVVDGMKLMPGNPSFLEARDAILQADLVDYGGAHLGRLWSGFAKRGMGCSAKSPNGSASLGVVEAFDVPGCATHIGFAGPGDLTLEFCDGALHGTHAGPFGPVFVATSLSQAAVPFKGGTLVPVPFLLLLTLPADGLGQFGVLVPCTEGPSTATLYLQALARDPLQPLDYEISGALKAVIEY